jgi:hypothetical protein
MAVLPMMRCGRVNMYIPSQLCNAITAHVHLFCCGRCCCKGVRSTTVRGGGAALPMMRCERVEKEPFPAVQCCYHPCTPHAAAGVAVAAKACAQHYRCVCGGG